MKKILIINGHPDADSFCSALVDAYRMGAAESGSACKVLSLADLSFNTNLAFGYRKRTEWEPDLQEAWELIQWAEHLVWIFPTWWGAWPAVMKGFIDRLFLPGKTFQKRENSLWWDKLLKGKTARIITTMDQPAWYYRLVYKAPSIVSLKKCTLQFCGVGPVRVTAIGPVRLSSVKYREKWLKRIERLGGKNS